MLYSYGSFEDLRKRIKSGEWFSMSKEKKDEEISQLSEHASRLRSTADLIDQLVITMKAIEKERK